MSAASNSSSADHAASLLALYDDALPQVHRYLMRRCGQRVLAEDLTSETFMAAVVAVNTGSVDTVTVAWLMGIARNKMVDYWRREEREQRRLAAMAGELEEYSDTWDLVIEKAEANRILAGLAPQHQAALTLRYIDGLPVAQVAESLGRTLHATEALLQRSKAAFRSRHDEMNSPRQTREDRSDD